MTVDALARLSSAQAMEETILSLARQGKTDQDIAEHLTKQGHRSPKGPVVLTSTVQGSSACVIDSLSSGANRIHDTSRATSPCPRSPIVLRSQSTGSTIGFTTARSGSHATLIRKIFLFPDTPMTITAFEQLKAGEIRKVCF